MHLDEVDQGLLDAVQIDFPLIGEPFSALGQRLGVGADDVLQRLGRLKATGAVRLIGPVLDARKLGYQSTLVAMRVAKSRLDRAAQAICQHPSVGHGYERDHYFNLWLTVTLPPEVELEAELQKLADLLDAEAIMNLPVLRVFKIGAYFDVAGDGQQMLPTPITSPSIVYQKDDLSPTYRAVINELQQDLPLVQRPFDDMAARLGMEVGQFMAHCRALQQRGIMRRFGASIRHNNIGFTANAMTCWVAPPEAVEVAGKRVAALREVSHCYERRTNPLWPYNLFAVIHERTREACQAIADKASQETGLDQRVLLFSLRELKKVRVRYRL